MRTYRDQEQQPVALGAARGALHHVQHVRHVGERADPLVIVGVGDGHPLQAEQPDGLAWLPEET
eukprot:268114-Prymnesium_polylepis.1